MHIYHPSPIYYTIDGNVEEAGVYLQGMALCLYVSTGGKYWKVDM